MSSIGHDTAAFQARKRPLLAGNSMGWGILVILHRQRGVAVMQVPGRVRPMLSVRQELHLHVGIGLESHGDLPDQGLTTRADSLWDMYTHQPGHRWHIVLPATPDHGVSLAHQKAIARVQTADCTVKIRQHSGVAAIDHIQEQPLVAVLGRHGLQQADICRALHQALRISGSELQVSNSGITGMVWVDRDVHCALQ